MSTEARGLPNFEAQERVEQLGRAVAYSAVHFGFGDEMRFPESANQLGVALSQEAVLEVFRNEKPGKALTNQELQTHITVERWGATYWGSPEPLAAAQLGCLQFGVWNLLNRGALVLSEARKIALNPDLPKEFSPLDEFEQRQT